MLIVDDNQGIQLLLLEVFTHQGYNVTMALTGAEALEILRINAFDIVMLDNNLPLLNGIEVIEKLIQEEINTKVILISGLIAGLVERTRDYHIVEAVIEKPFNLVDLCAIVKEIIQR